MLTCRPSAKMMSHWLWDLGDALASRAPLNFHNLAAAGLDMMGFTAILNTYQYRRSKSQIIHWEMMEKFENMRLYGKIAC